MNTLSIIMLILLGILILWGICDCIYDTMTYRVTSYEVTSPKIKKEFRFVVLSDLHNKTFGKNNSRLIAGIRQLHPDAVMIAGDMVTATEGDDVSGTVHLLTELAKDYPVYYGIGNHEEKIGRKPERYGSMYEDYVSALQKAGVKLLINEKRTLSEYGISICGLQMECKYFKRFGLLPMEREDLQRLVGVPERDKYQILIAHNPDYFPQYAEWGADLVLSGHNHGGIVGVPLLGGMVSPRCILFPKYDGGRFEEGQATMLLSRGLGTHTLPVRILNHAELLYVTCRPG
ncbi:MAG: metallophosphoesterase [Lachnospiraceae bacterium]|nr:metallophosphoesterase [Lachnospiraceae bacterium]